MHSLAAGSTQSWFIVKATVALSPILAFCVADVIGWVLRRTLWRHPEMPPPSATEPACYEPDSVAAPPR